MIAFIIISVILTAILCLAIGINHIRINNVEYENKENMQKLHTELFDRYTQQKELDAQILELIIRKIETIEEEHL